VRSPGDYSLEDLKRFPSRTPIARHTCGECWSAIAEWTGAPSRAFERRPLSSDGARLERGVPRLVTSDYGVAPAAAAVGAASLFVCVDG
jgi:hypothetical protein